MAFWNIVGGLFGIDELYRPSETMFFIYFLYNLETLFDVADSNILLNLVTCLLKFLNRNIS